MCGIAGFTNLYMDFLTEEKRWQEVLYGMNEVQKRRGPDDRGTYLDSHCGFAHVRLEIIDLSTGHQPMLRYRDSHAYSIVFNGEIYNMCELKQELSLQGATFSTLSDTEVILEGFLLYGADFIKKLNGIFAIAIWDSRNQQLFLFRDRLGIKPLFYTTTEHTLIFASEIKGLFAFPGITPTVNTQGLCEIFALGPAKTHGKGVFKDIREVLPGHMLSFHKYGYKETPYWQLESCPHTDSFEDTVSKTAWLVEDAVKKQMRSDIPISTFLSGGLDSSLITSICAKELKKQGQVLNTFSFDFQDNNKHFQSNNFQPSQDRPFVEQMVSYAGTNHKFLECNNEEQLQGLFSAVDARDLPCMADVESSMLYFCSQVAPLNKVTLTGECADEIFGGYPWFHSKEAFDSHCFPWSSSMEPRKSLLSEEFIQLLPMEEYARSAYEKTIKETPVLLGEDSTEKRRREISYLNLRWFMTTLLDRMDRTSMYCGLEARVPFADHRIVSYLFNVPWEIKCHNGIGKGLLRQAGVNHLPQEILWRKKSPYPKTYDPAYEQRLGKQLKEVLSDTAAPIRFMLDKKKLDAFLSSPSDYGKPWYGQLMAGPQMLAYLLQVNYWLETYHIIITLS